MKKLIIYILIVSSALSSCSHSPKKTEAFTTIHINPEKAAPVKYSTLYSKMEILPLKTDTGFLISEVDKMIVKNNRFYILSDDKILVFDSVGKPIFKVDKRGKGPGEYSYLIDFNVYDNDIELFDHRQQKMLIYDQTGSFKGEWKCNLSAYSFGRIDTGLYAFYVGVNGSEGEKNYKLKYYSKAEEKVVQEYFPVPENEYSFMYILESNFSSATNPLLFYYMTIGKDV